MPLRKRCEENNCFKYAIYGHLINNTVKIKYCRDHKKDEMITFDKCRNCLYTSYNRRIPNNKHYCSSCYVVLFPNETYSINYKNHTHILKQDLIHDIFKNMSVINWDSYDKVIEDTCCKRRPDYFKDFITHSIILEVDENQHDTYDMPCERKRELSLYYGLAKRPLIFIRFNPDSFITNRNEYESMFYFGDYNNLNIDVSECKKRLLFVNYVLEYYKNYDNVLNLINHCNKYKNQKIAEVKLFYDKDIFPKHLMKSFMKLYKLYLKKHSTCD